MDALTFMKSYATLHHVIRKGKMYGVLPYTHHLADVEGVLREFGETREFMFVGSWGHDLIEDTDIKARDIEENFGEDVARVVVAVSGDPSLPREARNALIYPKIRAAGYDAIRLKLADRIANVRNGLRTNGSMVKKYVKEYPTFRLNLWDEKDMMNFAMWMALDDLMKRAGSKTVG